MNRTKAVKYFKLVRYMADTFSKDPSTKVGCLLLAPDSLQILSLGYNGFPRGVDETNPQRWERPIKYSYVEHSERNCLYNACRSGVSTNNSIAVITLFPCCDCCRALIQSGIKTIITKTPDYDDERWGNDFKISTIMFNEAKTEIILLTEEEILEAT
jgi:dCMP deaminase